MPGLKIKYPKRIEYFLNFFCYKRIKFLLLAILIYTGYLIFFVLKYCFVEDTYIVTVIKEISVSLLYSSDDNLLTFRHKLEEGAKVCNLACFIIKTVFHIIICFMIILIIVLVYILSACLYYLCFKKGNQKTTKELLVEADRQVSNNWAIADQVSKFYLKIFAVC